MPETTKWEADFTFLSNMIDLVEAGSWWLRIPRMHIAMTYFKLVRDFGNGPK
jgi:hypothetical protein